MFGHDLESTRQLNRTVLPSFDESNIYRIDHYLGKETVQNILVFRFGNALFEPVWNRNYVDYVEITAAENVGVENRASFYEETGALRDMVENHMLQLVALTAMEPPIAFGRVPDRQAAVLSSLFPMSTFVLHFHTERNQQVPTAEKIVSSILSNQSRFRRYAFVLPLGGGLLFSGLGFFMGRTHLRLVLKGARAQGTIVDYRAETFTTARSGGTTSTSTAYMPVVEYSALGDRKVRFQDWLGTSVAGNRNQVVEVLYDPQNPSVAMIDRPIWNWIPWAPIIVLGVLLILSGIRRALHSLLGSPFLAVG